MNEWEIENTLHVYQFLFTKSSVSAADQDRRFLLSTRLHQFSGGRYPFFGTEADDILRTCLLTFENFERVGRPTLCCRKNILTSVAVDELN